MEEPEAIVGDDQRRAFLFDPLIQPSIFLPNSAEDFRELPRHGGDHRAINGITDIVAGEWNYRQIREFGFE